MVVLSDAVGFAANGIVDGELCLDFETHLVFSSLFVWIQKKQDADGTCPIRIVTLTGELLYFESNNIIKSYYNVCCRIKTFFFDRRFN